MQNYVFFICHSKKNNHFSRKIIAVLEIIATFARDYQINPIGEVLEWLKRHAWKACSRQNRLAGSNPVLSATQKGCNGRYIPFFRAYRRGPICGAHGAQAAQQNVFPIRIFYPEKTSIPSAKQSIYLYINWLQVYSLRLQPVTGDGLGIILNVPPHQ